MAKATPPIELTQEQVTAITVWSAAKEQLEAVKATEIKHRLIVIESVPFNADKEEGGQTVKLGAGWKLALDRTLNYTMDKDTQKVVAALNQLAETNPGAAAELIRWEAVLSTGAYKKLTDEEKKIIAPVLTIKPGTPSLALKEPTAPKA